MTTPTPVIGAALPVEQLETYRGWLLDKNRDVEIQRVLKSKLKCDELVKTSESACV